MQLISVCYVKVTKIIFLLMKKTKIIYKQTDVDFHQLDKTFLASHVTNTHFSSQLSSRDDNVCIKQLTQTNFNGFKRKALP